MTISTNFKSIFFFLTLISSIPSFSQDCNSLRGANEKSYATTAEGKTLSFCDVPNPTPYTKCLCEKELKSKKAKEAKQATFDAAAKKSNLAKEAYLAGSNLIIEAKVGKDPAKIQAAKKFFNQAIKYAKEANAIYDSYYNNLPSGEIDSRVIYKEYPTGVIEWSGNEIANMPNVKKDIKSVEKTLTINFKSSNNNWDSPEITKEEKKITNDDKVNQFENYTQTEIVNWLKDYVTFELQIRNEYGVKQTFFRYFTATGYEKGTDFEPPPNSASEYYKRIIQKVSFGCMGKIIKYITDKSGIGFFLSEYCGTTDRIGKPDVTDNRGIDDVFDVSFNPDSSYEEHLDKIIDAFLQLAVLNGADKSKIISYKN